MVIIHVHVVVDSEGEVSVHLFCELGQVRFVDDFDVVVEFGVYDEFYAEDLVAVDDLFEVSFDFYGDTFVRLDDACSMAVGASGEHRLCEGATVSLARHFH